MPSPAPGKPPAGRQPGPGATGSSTTWRRRRPRGAAMVGAYAGNGRRRRTARHYDARAAQESHFVDGGRFDQSVFRAESRRQDDGPDVMKANRLVRCVHERRWFGQFRDGLPCAVNCTRSNWRRSAHRASPNATEAPRSSANRARLLSTRARRPNMFMPRISQGAETQTVTAAGTSQLQVSRQPCRRAGQVCQGLVHQRRPGDPLEGVRVSRRGAHGARPQHRNTSRPARCSPSLIDTLPALCRRSAPVLAVVVPVVVLGRIEH